jgi:murein peptide amidase A
LDEKIIMSHPVNACAYMKKQIFSWALLLVGLFACIGTKASPIQDPVEQRQEIRDWCDRLAAKLKNKQSDGCAKYPFVIAPTRSVQRQIIPYMDVGTPASKENLRVLVIGGIHGDEWTAISLVFYWLNWMLVDPLGKTHWRVFPLVNPDGFIAKRSTRTNARGVDLNRNFPTPDWKSHAHLHWVTKTRKNPRRYPGPMGNSEPETRLIVDQIEQYRPHLILSLHAPYGLIDYDGVEQHAPLRFGLLPLRRLGVSPGSLGNYAGVHLGIPVVTVELENARQMPPIKDVMRMWKDLLIWLSVFPER